MNSSSGTLWREKSVIQPDVGTESLERSAARAPAGAASSPGLVRTKTDPMISAMVARTTAKIEPRLTGAYWGGRGEQRGSQAHRRHLAAAARCRLTHGDAPGSGAFKGLHGARRVRIVSRSKRHGRRIELVDGDSAPASRGSPVEARSHSKRSGGVTAPPLSPSAGRYCETPRTLLRRLSRGRGAWRGRWTRAGADPRHG